ncbi:MAG: uracil-DNA glycosylase family protein [Nitrospirota bacterium]
MRPWRRFGRRAYGTSATGYLLVGEAPGYVSWKNRRRFTGPAGLFVRRALRLVGHARCRDLEDLFYMTDVVKCHPARPGNPRANRSPRQAEVRACAGFLLREMTVLNPSVVVTFGKLAAEGVAGAIGRMAPGSAPKVLSFPHPSPRNRRTILRHYPSLSAFEESLTQTFCRLIMQLDRRSPVMRRPSR